MSVYNYWTKSKMRVFCFNVACYFLANVCVDFRKKSLFRKYSCVKHQVSIGCHLEISLLLLMSAENTKTFVSLKFCFLGFVNHNNELFLSYLWSFGINYNRWAQRCMGQELCGCTLQGSEIKILNIKINIV